jgi:hypothetical protein
MKIPPIAHKNAVRIASISEIIVQEETVSILSFLE